MIAERVRDVLSTRLRHAFDLLSTCLRPVHARHASLRPGFRPGFRPARLMEFGELENRRVLRSVMPRNIRGRARARPKVLAPLTQACSATIFCNMIKLYVTSYFFYHAPDPRGWAFPGIYFVTPLHMEPFDLGC